VSTPAEPLEREPSRPLRRRSTRGPAPSSRPRPPTRDADR
jgi:hypothetical protein